MYNKTVRENCTSEFAKYSKRRHIDYEIIEIREMVPPKSNFGSLYMSLISLHLILQYFLTIEFCEQLREGKTTQQTSIELPCLYCCFFCSVVGYAWTSLFFVDVVDVVVVVVVVVQCFSPMFIRLVHWKIPIYHF